MHLSSLSKAMVNLIVCVASQLVAHLVPAISSEALMISLASALLGMYFLVSHKRDLLKITDTCEECAAGEMERRIILPHACGEMLSLMNAANRFIDVADAYIREACASAEHAAQGKFYRTILPSGLNGTWKKSAIQLNDSSQKVRQNLIETVRGAGNKLEASVMQTILKLSSSTQQLMSTSTSLSGIAQKGSGEAASLSSATANVSENMNTIAAAVEEMTAAIKEISQQVNNANNLARDAAEEGTHTRSVLADLEASSDHIGEVAQLISDIAKQVNLLALNATIEAARAGDAGKGFAVVASEVKNLATRTADATEQVSEYIQKARSEVGRTSDALASILGKVATINEASCLIAAAVEEQSATTLEISKNLQKTSHVTQGFAESVESMAQSSIKTQSVSEEVKGSSAALALASDTLKLEVVGFLKSLEGAA